MATTTKTAVRFTDRHHLQMLREKLQQHLDNFSKETGLAVSAKVGNCTFGDVNCSFKIEFGPEGVTHAREREQWNRYTFSVTANGIKPEALDQVFTFRGVDYKITGLSLTRRKMPIFCVRVKDGAEMFFAAVTVRASLPEAFRAPVQSIGREIL